jgi:DNA-binding beta-propeller fold protein YncE
MFHTKRKWKCLTWILERSLAVFSKRPLFMESRSLPISAADLSATVALSTVTIFDLKTLKPIADVPTGKKPDAIIFDPATSRVFAFNGDSNSATAIDAASGKVARTVDLGGGREFAAADGNGFIYNNLEDQNQVVKIDSRKLTIVQRWPTAPCSSPSSMAIDRANHRLLIGCRSKVVAVMNAITGRVITTLPIGDLVDATVFDSGSTPTGKERSL